MNIFYSISSTQFDIIAQTNELLVYINHSSSIKDIFDLFLFVLIFNNFRKKLLKHAGDYFYTCILNKLALINYIT